MKFTVADSSSDEDVLPALPVVVTTVGHPATAGQIANKRKKSKKTNKAPVMFADDTTSDDSTSDDASSYHTGDDEDDTAHDV